MMIENIHESFSKLFNSDIRSHLLFFSFLLFLLSITWSVIVKIINLFKYSVSESTSDYFSYEPSDYFLSYGPADEDFNETPEIK